MFITVEGVYRNGQVELNETPPGLEDGDEVIVYLQKKTPLSEATRPQYMTFGMIKTLGDLTEEDFKSAEFHGDPDDGLDWSGC